VRHRADGAHDVWRYRWIILGIATFTQAASGFFVQGIGALGIHPQRELNLSTAQLGLLISAARLAPLAGLVVARELLDRYYERWVVGAGACVVAAGLGVEGSRLPSRRARRPSAGSSTPPAPAVLPAC
jgi:hypothetical protein